jgi:hypothetical protein
MLMDLKCELLHRLHGRFRLHTAPENPQLPRVTSTGTDRPRRQPSWEAKGGSHPLGMLYPVSLCPDAPLLIVAPRALTLDGAPGAIGGVVSGALT